MQFPIFLSSRQFSQQSSRYLYSLLLSSLVATSLSWDCENGLRVKFEWLNSVVLSPIYQAKWGRGDPSVEEQVSLTDWPSRRVWFLGKPLITGELGGSEKKTVLFAYRHSKLLANPHWLWIFAVGTQCLKVLFLTHIGWQHNFEAVKKGDPDVARQNFWHKNLRNLMLCKDVKRNLRKFCQG